MQKFKELFNNFDVNLFLLVCFCKVQGAWVLIISKKEGSLCICS